MELEVQTILKCGQKIDYQTSAIPFTPSVILGALATTENGTMTMKQELTLDWYEVCRLLESRQYKQVTELLQQAQVSCEHTRDGVLRDILSAAYLICLACSRCREEKRWLKWACDEADRGEQELRQELHDIFNLLSRAETSEAWTQRVALPAISIAEPASAAHDDPEPGKGLALLERTKRLLKWRLSPFLSPEQRDPRKRDEAPTLPATSNDVRLTISPVLTTKSQKPSSPSLAVYCLGPFQVYQDDQLVADWPASKGKLIFKYMISHRSLPVAKEVLMELFWPDAHPDAARNNLNVAIYGLRKGLRQTTASFSHILFQDECYLFNPDLRIWVDSEAFIKHLTAAQTLERHGELVAAIREYRAAEALYQGDFLGEDRYQDWLMPLRQSLQADYLNLLDRLSRYYLDQEEYDLCVTMCDKMLAVDSCREEAHCRLMRCYSQQRQPYLALRQYHLCVKALKEDLDVPPAQTTTALYEQIQNGNGKYI